MTLWGFSGKNPTPVMHISFPRFFWLFTLSLLLPGSLKGIIIDDFSTETNDRFANDGAFVAGAFNLSGVAFNGRWITMLSPNVFISANHFAPSAGSSFTFFESNDANGPSVTRTISGTSTQIGNTDIFLGTLNTHLPSSYTYYSIATESISSTPGPNSFNSSVYNGANAYVLGRSPTTWPTAQNIAVGRNKLDRFFSNIEVDSESGDAIGATINETGDANYVTFEAQLQPGDSGGPLFVEDGSGTLALVGINWFTGSSSAGDELFGAAYLGNYSTEINSWVATHTIPEPRFYALGFGFIAFFWILYRRRSNHSQQL